MTDLERHRREGLRADILLVLNVARPAGANEKLIARTLGDAYDDVGPSELRREIDYLERKNLVEIPRRDPIWKAELTPKGVDVVEGATETPPGISELR